MKSAWFVSWTKIKSALTIEPASVVPTACTVQPVGALAVPTTVPAPTTVAQPMYSDVRLKYVTPFL